MNGFQGQTQHKSHVHSAAASNSFHRKDNIIREQKIITFIYDQAGSGVMK